MEPNRELFAIYKPEEDMTKIIIHHTLLMLSRRIFINKKKEKQALLESPAEDKLKDMGDNTYVIPTLNGKNYAFKIIYHKITTIGKNSIISEFIKNYADDKKIIIASEFTSKIQDFAMLHGVQIFEVASMLRDIMAYKDQPKHELLSPEEMEQVKKEYGISNYTINKTQYKLDPIPKYLGLKKSDIYRVIRPSPVSGYHTNYRIVT